MQGKPNNTAFSRLPLSLFLVTALATVLSCGPESEEQSSAKGMAMSRQALATRGGPVILGGDDLTQHGSWSGTAPQAGWFYIQKALDNLRPHVSRANDGTVAVLGSADSTARSGDAGAAYHYAAPLVGLSPQFYNNVAGIDSFFAGLKAGTLRPAILVMAGTGAANNLDANEGRALSNHASEIADFVNSGGGLLAHGSGSVAYGWLTTLLPGIVESGGCDVNSLLLTAEGQSAFPNLTNAHIRAGPCHSNFSGDMGDLKALARDGNGNGRNIIIGGASVQLPGSITLAPSSVTYVLGSVSSHTVTATVRDGNLNPVERATVTFVVGSGPNAGATGTAVSNASGQASFTYSSNGAAGTDLITASFVDATNTPQTSAAVEAIWKEPPNRAPTANAGGPYSTPEGSSVTLSGSASSDPDGDALTYAWDLDLDGAYDDASGPTTSFFGSDGPRTHTVGLRVCDARVCSSTTATVNVVNVAPVVTAEANQTVFRHTAVSVTGTWTDPAGAADNQYTWAWDLNGDGSFEISGQSPFGAANSQTTSFAAGGVYTLRFRVTDKNGASHSDTVTITVVNRPPVAQAGGPYTTSEGSSVTLSGSASSDPDGDALTYAWDLDLDGSYDDASGATASFYGVDGPATHQVGLRVCDSVGDCATTTATVHVVNVAPVVTAEADQTVFRHTAVSVTGTWTDPAGDADNAYTWEWDLNGDGSFEVSGQSPFGAANTQVTSFSAPGTYTLMFRVTDKDGASHSDTVTITVVNRPPVAQAGGPYSTPEGSSVTLSGSASSDPDGDALTYAWDLDLDGSYDNASGPTANFFGVDGPSTHTVGLRVCDTIGDCTTTTATVNVVNVAPVVTAEADQTVFRNAPVPVTGTWTDPAEAADNQYTWEWDLDGNGSFEVSGASSYGMTVAQTTSFGALGTYTLTFRVTDKDGASHSDTVTITVVNRPPDCSAAAPSIASIWPPNHKMVDISVLGLTDPDNDPLTITITSIFQDEPVNDIADGNTDFDGAGVGTSTAQVRAERSGSKKNPGNGRVYHIGFTTDDGYGGSCSGVVRVGVPHDQGGQSIPVDDGPLYDSTTL